MADGLSQLLDNNVCQHLQQQQEAPAKEAWKTSREQHAKDMDEGTESTKRASQCADLPMKHFKHR